MSQTNGKLPEGCEWKDPPGPMVDRWFEKWPTIVKHCRANPKRWLFVGRSKNSASYFGSAKRHGLEVTARRTGEFYETYVRYVPVPAPLVHTPAAAEGER